MVIAVGTKVKAKKSLTAYDSTTFETIEVASAGMLGEVVAVKLLFDNENKFYDWVFNTAFENGKSLFWTGNLPFQDSLEILQEGYIMIITLIVGGVAGWYLRKFWYDKIQQKFGLALASIDV